MAQAGDQGLAVAVFGATGRMGSAVIDLVTNAPNWTLSGAFGERRGDSLVSGVQVSTDPLATLDGADVAVDFTLPGIHADIVAACVAAGVPLVCGTTGLSEQDERTLVSAAESIPLLYDHNMSLGVAVLTALVGHASAVLSDYDLEIVETHHRDKIDAPSGTAIKLGRAAAEGRGQDLGKQAIWSRSGKSSPREAGAIGFSSIRGGQVAGIHQVHLYGERETLMLEHEAMDRSVFAEGALAAARWVAAARAGSLYSLADVVGLRRDEAGNAES